MSEGVALLAGGRIAFANPAFQSWADTPGNSPITPTNVIKNTVQ